MKIKIDVESAKLAAQLLKQLGHPDRLLIICNLVDGSLSAGQLAERSTLKLSAFSQHLAVLRTANLIKVDRQAQTLFYSIHDQSVLKIVTVLKEIYCPNL